MITLRRAAAGGFVLAASVAHAEPTRNIELSVFDPTPTTSGSTFQVQNADVGDSGEYAVSTIATYASKPLVLGTDTSTMVVVKNQTKLSLGGAYAFGGRFEAGLRIPLYMQSGDPITPGETGVEPASGAALGDITLHAKARFVGVRNAPVRAGLGLGLTVPTRTADQFTGVRLPSARVLALVSIAAGRALTFHLNVGGVLREKSQFANIQQGSGATVGAGVSLRAFEKVFFDAQVYGDLIPSGDHDRPSATDPMGAPALLKTVEWLAGARYVVSPTTSIGLGAGRGLTSGIGEPELRGVLTFAFTPGGKALPPLHVAPPPIVIDPNVEDSDYDKLVDAKDKCPKEGEDKDGFEDEDGCPDPDNDKDGVLDAKDKCPLIPEDRDGFADGDGCPDPDNDKDGVLDAQDKCPDKAEKINGNQDDDGCPDTGDSLVISNPDRLEMIEPVLFTKTDEISPDSANQMNQLAVTLRARSDIKRLRIGVHVQPTKSAKKDQALSDKRATAVREWLVKFGIDTERIEVKGFGGTVPLVKPQTKGAEMINNRVEMIILERG